MTSKSLKKMQWIVPLLFVGIVLQAQNNICPDYPFPSFIILMLAEKADKDKEIWAAYNYTNVHKTCERPGAVSDTQSSASHFFIFRLGIR